jgi:hypothetical protein
MAASPYQAYETAPYQAWETAPYQAWGNHVAETA